MSALAQHPGPPLVTVAVRRAPHSHVAALAERAAEAVRVAQQVRRSAPDELPPPADHNNNDTTNQSRENVSMTTANPAERRR